ncbi:hypothetical protein BDQ12DRAFT_739866 [Crucibulum laeve]|uniref:HNH nuclease domain-containing protein n=1 Tax=Crucibulum laeve TaxID=68775 RepID=A0A5C3LFU3_9AGAR|nr:hypothetical protein BDQ12DRAFT_739866 [Crucibulum laeve]
MLSNIRTSIDAAQRTMEVINTDKKLRLLQSMQLRSPTEKGRGELSRFILEIRREYENVYLAATESAEMRILSTQQYNLKESQFALQYQKEIAKVLMRLQQYYECSLFLPILGNKTRVIENPYYKGSNYYGTYAVEACCRSDNKEELLNRDKFRCRATGRKDLSMAKQGTGIPNNWNPFLTDYLQAAHIIPYFLNNFKDKTEKKMHRIIWQALNEFSGYDLSKLKGKGINDLSNMFMLCPSAHKMHDDLRLSFYPSPENANKYNIKTYDKTANWLDVVTPVDLHTNINKEWLAIHHAMCEVLQECGSYDELKKLSSAM